MILSPRKRILQRTMRRTSSLTSGSLFSCRCSGLTGPSHTTSSKCTNPVTFTSLRACLILGTSRYVCKGI